MTEFASISSLLREKCEDNPELQKCCNLIAEKYFDFVKKEFRAQYAREENIILKLDIGNLESVYRTVTENNQAQAELDSLLMEFYDEHLKFAFDIDECELEKLACYDEIKLELETRDSINMYQGLYERKVKMAKKMEERNIVKQYRQVEEEYLKTETERLDLEEKVNKLKAKAKKFEERRLDENKLIVELVQGSVLLEGIFAEICPQKSQSQISRLTLSQHLSGITGLPDLNNQKVGLSSRLLVNFKQFKMPSIPALPRIRKITQKNGLNRLLQQSEVIRKSMQTSPIALSGDFATSKLPGILKNASTDFLKPLEVSQKTVSFDVDSHKDTTRIFDTEEATPKTPCDYLQPSCLETIVDDSEMDESLTQNENEPDRNKIEITGIEIIKPANKIPKNEGVSQTKLNTKRKADNEDFEGQDQSPPKIKYSPNQQKSFMDMFMDLSKDTSQVLSTDFEPSNKNLKEIVKPTTGIEKTKVTKEKKTTETNNKSIIKKQETKPQTKASNKPKKFDGFEEFLSQFASDIVDNKEHDQPADDMSFDFGNDDEADDIDDNDDDDGCDNLSFEF